jgi:Zinc knuckle/Zinc finger C-x8-C-x5-C-x3-H type (and similar)
VRLSTLPKQNLSSANIGCGVYARRASYANFYTNTTLKRCLSAGFIQSLGNAQIRNVYIFTLIRNRKCLIVHGMPEDFASMVNSVLILGSECRNKHARQAVCPNYLTGFCPKGSNCSFGHPRFEIPTSNVVMDLSQADQDQQRQQQGGRQQQQQGGGRGDNRDRPQRSMSEVTCFKCGETGHFANNCSNQFSQQQNKRQRYE